MNKCAKFHKIVQTIKKFSTILSHLQPLRNLQLDKKVLPSAIELWERAEFVYNFV